MKPVVQDGVDVNESFMPVNRFTLTECEAFLKAYGNVRSDVVAESGNISYNLWKVANRLADLVKSKPTKPDPEVIFDAPIVSVTNANFIDCTIVGHEFNFENCNLIGVKTEKRELED